ncbi:MAG: cupin domain-containing protein [Chloroflexi bacterium]|nr:cupin domain-containing protein [Chloroflexota bacterium]
MEENAAVGQDIRVVRWDRESPPVEEELYARMEAEGYVPYLRAEPPGTKKPLHRHPFPEITWVLSGWMRYSFPLGEGAEPSPVMLKAGDRIDLPADLPHETAVEGAAYAVYLTASPFALPVVSPPPGVNI